MLAAESLRSESPVRRPTKPSRICKMVLPNIPHSRVKEVTEWTNFHGTIEPMSIPVYCTPDALQETGGPAPRRFTRHGDAIKALLGHCLDNGKKLRVLGAQW